MRGRGAHDTHATELLRMLADESALTAEDVERELEIHPGTAQVQNAQGRLPLHVACQGWPRARGLIRHAAAATIVKRILASYPGAATTSDLNGKLPLHVLCENCLGFAFTGLVSYADAFNFLLHKAQTAAASRDDLWRFPLHVLCAHAFEDYAGGVIAPLICAHPDARSQSDVHGHTPLHLLFLPRSGRNVTDRQEHALVCIDALLDGMPPSTSPARRADEKGCTPLHILSREDTSGDEEVFRRVRDAFPEAIGKQDNEGFVPLLWLARNAKLKDASKTEAILPLLVSGVPGVAEDALAGLANSDGSTPLHFVCRYKRRLDQAPGLATALLRMAPETAAARDEQGYTPLHHLCYYQPKLTVEMVRIILRAHPSACADEDPEGAYPLHSACEKQRFLALDVLELLVDKSPVEAASARVPAPDGMTALHLLALHHSRITAELLAVLRDKWPAALRVQAAVDIDGVVRQLIPLDVLKQRGELDKLSYPPEVFSAVDPARVPLPESTGASAGERPPAAAVRKQGQKSD
eukprot:CAMPEP_0206062690 /NCGR_PEP_ID=MMETSP1466-20131121/57776_1 /ASSEMBLY_ACC=CAM_ASM_001126 /TAXON_ID=44452 /ORGANISM="Pavlova gyrans, Strain CCMP608" /LENGTH=523 /DNA_ID=CAMNT_0053438055 /DNA_START=15 /DNA_END=1583 /DNA_ORIENTATION=+